jgi:3-oxoacyl-[acyl-carrier-protein] synthase III
MGIGITAVETYIPSQKLAAEEMHVKYGVPLDFLQTKMLLLEKPISGSMHPSEMAFAAVQNLLSKNEIDPACIDLIVYCSTGLHDYQLWSPSAKLQSMIGAKNAYCFEVTNGCNSANLGLHVCRSLIQANTQYRNALLVMSDALSKFVDHTDAKLKSVLNFADAASAAFIQTNVNRLNILSSRFITDSEFVDLYCIENGGTRAMEMQRPNPFVSFRGAGKDVSGLHHAYLENLEKVIATALQEVDLSRRDIDFLFINQGDHRVMHELLEAFGLSEEHSLASYKHYGHMGSTDTLHALQNGLASDRFKPGDIIIIASSGVGFSWGASVLRY